MTSDTTKIVYMTLGKGATAQLREIAEKCEDRDTARVIYAELRRIAHQMNRKHNFEIRRKEAA